MDDLTAQEYQLLEEHHLRQSQLRNIRRVIFTATPKKAKKLEQEVLPGYIVRDLHARDRAEKLMKKKGWIRK